MKYPDYNFIKIIVENKIHAKFPSWPFFDSKYPRAHLHQHLLPCNDLHDHRQTHTDRVSSNKKECNIQ